MDVQAGTIDANGHTVATDLSGTAYSVFSKANSTLYITRSDNTSLQIGDKFPEFTDDQGNQITDGAVAQRDIENNGTQYSGGGVYGWIINNSDEIANKVTKAVFLKDIRPRKTTMWFFRLKNLKEISGMQTHLDTSNVTDISYMFYYCSGLTILDVSKFNTKNAINMECMFLGCSGLTLLDVSNFDTSKVTSMYQMFYNCSKLTSLDVSNFADACLV